MKAFKFLKLVSGLHTCVRMFVPCTLIALLLFILLYRLPLFFFLPYGSEIKGGPVLELLVDMV